MRLKTPLGTVQVIDEPGHSIGSADNARSYALEVDLAVGSRASSIHGVLLDDAPVAVFSNGGGASAVHEHSAVYRNGFLYLAVGDNVVCLSLRPPKVIWSTKVDSATCFGIYFHEPRDAFVSHGELEIARLSEDGAILWSESGADTFSEGFALLPDCVEAVDFEKRIYRFRYEDGLELTG